MRVLVTGATGRIGANVAKHLVEAGHEVMAVVRPDTDRADKLAGLDLEIRGIDLRDREGLTACVRGMEAIVHLGVKLRGPSHYDQLDVNLAPTLTLLEAARLHCPDLRRFVFGSSDVLWPKSGWIPRLLEYEDRASWPAGLYAWAKLSGEVLVHTYHRQFGLPTVILNIPHTFCGRELLGQRHLYISPFIEHHAADLERQEPSEARDRALQGLRRGLQEGKELVVPLCPEGPPFKRHLGDVRDVAEAHARALTAEAAVGHAFLIASRPFDWGIAVPHLARLTGMYYCEVTFPEASFYEYDLRKTELLLGFQPRYGPEAMIEDAWRHEMGEEIGVIDVGPDHPV